jgi:acyl-CoA synthetase (AMP-forming)/AMP-acid ligase II
VLEPERHCPPGARARLIQILHKDVVVSGGENISTVEVEQTLVSHDVVADAAVIGVPDKRWGQRPKAFVVLVHGQQASEEEIIDHVRRTLPTIRRRTRLSSWTSC